MRDLAAEKAAARKAAYARRKSAHSDELTRAGVDRLIAFLDPYKGKALSGYMAIRTEIDPLRAMCAMAKHGIVGVPIIVGEGKPLEFRRWNAYAPMIEGPFGAQVPIDAEVIVPQVMIVPMVAFDAAGHRLGYGGGFYDRTLEKLRAAGPVVAVGFAYAAQQVDALPHEPTDQPLDAIVTNAGVLTF